MNLCIGELCIFAAVEAEVAWIGRRNGNVPTLAVAEEWEHWQCSVTGVHTFVVKLWGHHIVESNVPLLSTLQLVVVVVVVA